MTDNIEHLILEHLKAIRADVSSLKADMREVKMRLLSLESYQAAMHTDSVHHSTRMEELEQRIERVERRLDLRDNNTPY